MATFLIISNGHFNFRRWYLLFFCSATVLLLAVLLPILPLSQVYLYVGFFVLLYAVVYYLFVKHWESFEIFDDRIDIRERGRLARRFQKNNLAKVRFRLAHPSMFMTGMFGRYHTQHFIQFIEKQEFFEYEVLEGDMHLIVKHLQSMNYQLTDLAGAMDYFQEDSFYRYALNILSAIVFTLGIIFVAAYLYLV